MFPNARSTSISGPIPQQSNNARNNTASIQHIATPENQQTNGREPSPTLPSLPSHPTLNALISSSLGETTAGAALSLPSDPAILTSSLHQPETLSGPRIGDPGKRMLGAALGVRHPGLGHRMSSGNGHSPGSSPIQAPDHTMRDMQRAMGGLVVAE